MPAQLAGLSTGWWISWLKANTACTEAVDFRRARYYAALMSFSLPLAATALHVFAVIFWIGGISAAGWISANRAKAGSPERQKAAAELALGLYRQVAAPGFVLAFTFGMMRLFFDPQAYMRAHWFHGKLTLALIVIALHHILGARFKRQSQEADADSAEIGRKSQASAKLTFGLVLCALGVVLLVVLKGSLVP